MGNLHEGGELPVSASDDDETLLSAVLAHYRSRRADSGLARALLERLGISDQLADTLGIGVSDRSLGLCLPKRRIGTGDAIRDRLVALGLYRPSGHEHLVGCLVVPVRDCSGVVALVGLRLERPAEQLFVDGLPGGVFNEGCLSSGSAPVLVVSLLAETLLAIGAGFDVLPPRTRRWLQCRGGPTARQIRA